MSTTRKGLRIALVFAVIPLLAVSCGEERAQQLLRDCRKLEIGMTSAQVEAIMGKPSVIMQQESRGGAEEVFIYPSPRRASEKTSCVIDKGTDLVIEVRCGEGYRWTQEDAKCAKLREGISRDMVVRIMGEPSFVEQSEMLGDTEEWLYFVSPRHPQKVTKCVVDKKTGVLKRIYCD